MKKYNKFIIYLSLWLFFQPVSLFSQNEEFIIKTALVEKFARFTEWPENLKIEGSPQNFVIGLFGKEPLGGDIERIYSELSIKIKTREIKFKKFNKVDEIEQVHMLLISSITKKKLKNILQVTANKPILIISDKNGFGEKGVHINFYFDNNRIQFEINETAVHMSKLSMSYLLLRAAKIINKWK